VSVEEKVRVGFVLGQTPDWIGGMNYFRNLLSAVASVPNARIEPIIFTAPGGTESLRIPPEFKVVETGILGSRHLTSLLRRGLKAALGYDSLLQSCFAEHRIRVVSHAAKSMSIPTVGWIPDFQHRYLRDFISKEEGRARDQAYMAICERCEKVIVSSESAKADLQEFAPQFAGKAEVLQFVARIPPFSDDPACLKDLQERYGFVGPYILLPNQFWAHKNHRVVADALECLRRQGRSVTVLATGSTVDNRNPGFFNELMSYMHDREVQGQFHVLGVVPSEDLGSLMRYSVGFINPSRFEGWSTSVEEAKSLGKPLILSDIGVHREQKPQRGVYFQVDDSHGLAEAMWQMWNCYDPAEDSNHRQKASEEQLARQRQFALRFQEIILNVAQVSKGGRLSGITNG